MLAEDTGYFRTMSTLFLTPDSRSHLCNEVYSFLGELFDNHKAVCYSLNWNLKACPSNVLPASIGQYFCRCSDKALCGFFVATEPITHPCCHVGIATF